MDKEKGQGVIVKVRVRIRMRVRVGFPPTLVETAVGCEGLGFGCGVIAATSAASVSSSSAIYWPP